MVPAAQSVSPLEFLSAALNLGGGTRQSLLGLMAPAMIPSQPFPIAAVVAAGMAVVVAGAIIVVFSMSQKRRRQQTPGRPAAAAGGPVNQAPTVQARGVTFQLPFPDLESRRADGSTISISSPVELQNAH